MKELIKMFDWSNDREKNLRNNLGENQISFWYNKKNGGYSCTFSTNKIRTAKFVNVGMLNDRIALVFNDNNGFPVRKSGNVNNQNRQTRSFSSKELIEMVYKINDKPLDKDKFRIVLGFDFLTDEIILINNK
jgi:hypothetical protein